VRKTEKSGGEDQTTPKKEKEVGRGEQGRGEINTIHTVGRHTKKPVEKKGGREREIAEEGKWNTAGMNHGGRFLRKTQQQEAWVD